MQSRRTLGGLVDDSVIKWASRASRRNCLQDRTRRSERTPDKVVLGDRGRRTDAGRDSVRADSGAGSVGTGSVGTGVGGSGIGGSGIGGSAWGAFAIVTSLFFAWGSITSLIDPLVSAVKGIFSLSDVEAQLSASAFFIAYGVMSFPAAVLLSRRKAVPTIMIALGMMVAGCLLMLLAANIAVYGLVLLGLFVLASGITILQVAANPLAAALGKPEQSHFRLTLSQTFNSLGTFVGPYLGTVLFLKGVEVKQGTTITDEVRANALGGIDSAFFWIAGLIVLLAVFIWASRRLITAAAPAAPGETARRGIAVTFADAVSSRWALLGGAAIFLYVGAEVAIGTQTALFLNSDGVLGVSLEQAAKMVSLYWGGAMIGRIVGSALLIRIPATTLLALIGLLGALLPAPVLSQVPVLIAVIAMLIVGINGMIAVLLPYAAENYSLAIRGRATGLIAGSSKLGGVAVQGFALIGLIQTLGEAALGLLVPMGLFAVFVGYAGRETRGRSLRDLETGLT